MSCCLSGAAHVNLPVARDGFRSQDRVRHMLLLQYIAEMAITHHGGSSGQAVRPCQEAHLKLACQQVCASAYAVVCLLLSTHLSRISAACLQVEKFHSPAKSDLYLSTPCLCAPCTWRYVLGQTWSGHPSHAPTKLAPARTACITSAGLPSPAFQSSVYYLPSQDSSHTLSLL